MSCKRRAGRKKNRKLILSWKEHWGCLCELVNRCIDQKEPPSDEQEDEFHRLHTWFAINRANFIPIWQNFEQFRTSGAHEEWDKYDPRTKMLHEHWRDPFSVIYQAPSLKQAIISWGILKSGMDHWLNEYQDKFPFKHALVVLHERLEELLASQ